MGHRESIGISSSALCLFLQTSQGLIPEYRVENKPWVLGWGLHHGNYIHKKKEKQRLMDKKQL